MNTIIPWISGGLVLLLGLGLWQTIRFWRESKRSPYYFLRKQAEQRMQTYSMGSVAAAVTLLFFVSYAWQPVEDTSLRMIEIPNTKPLSLSFNQSESITPNTNTTEAIAEADDTPNVVALEGNNAIDVTADLIASQSADDENRLTADSLSQLDGLEAVDSISAADVEVASLPAEYNQIDAVTELADDTIISTVTFANQINEISYAPEVPSKLYETGFYTVYATFDYENMADGMVWSWVWRQNGRVIGGGNEMWQYGNDGPGYIFLAPVDGFTPGEYTVEIWVNGDLQVADNMFVTEDLASSSQ